MPSTPTVPGNDLQWACEAFSIYRTLDGFDLIFAIAIDDDFSDDVGR